MLDKLVDWYHLPLAHVGMTRLKTTKGTHFNHPKLEERIRSISGICDPSPELHIAGTTMAYWKLRQLEFISRHTNLTTLDLLADLANISADDREWQTSNFVILS
jgi:hypothetical protein